MSSRLANRVFDKTAAYTIKPWMDQPGTIFTNRGAVASVTFTLPIPNTATKGFWYEFEVKADFALIVAGAAAGDILTFGNTSADNVSFETASNLIGRRIFAYCDGTQWHGFGSGPGFMVNAALVTPVAASGLLQASGVAAGYKIARVEIALDGSNPTPWATGLTTIIAGGGSLKGTAAPGVGTSILTFAISTTTLNIYAWKVTGAGDTTLIASTGTESVYAWAIGT